MEQGKFLRPIEPLGEYLKQRGVDWTYYRDKPSLRLLEEQPRPWLRPVQPLPPAGGLRDLLAAWAPTSSPSATPPTTSAKRCCATRLFTGRLSALPPVTQSRDRQFRLIRPLVFVTEEITRAYAEARAVPLTPCDCSLRTGTVRRSLRGLFGELEKEYPHLKENLLSAMGNVDTEKVARPAVSRDGDVGAVPDSERVGGRLTPIPT